jgi:hypothetical protein
MGWETRSGSSGRYYTRTRRVSDGYRREYIGTGPAADAIAALDAQARADRSVARDQLQALIARDQQADDAVAALNHAVEALARGALVAAGFHQHARGEWRRRRVPNTPQRHPESEGEGRSPAVRADAGPDPGDV